MANKSNNPSSCFLYILAAILVITILGIAVYIVAVLLPSAAVVDFGPAQAELSTFKQLQLSTLLILNRDDLLNPQFFGAEPVAFTVNPGEGASNVAYNLQYQGLIPNAETFINYMVYKGYDTAIQQGEFTLTPGMKPVEVADLLLKQEIGIVVLPGHRLGEVAQMVEANTNVTAQEFLQVALQPTQYGIVSSLPIENGLEGFIIPMTYAAAEGETTAFVLISMMLRETEAVITPELIGQFTANGLSVQQAVTMASMIERENHINIPNEMEQMASVFYNRMAIGMAFQSDPTVQYGLRNLTGSGDWWPAITQADYTAVDSLYNTYLYPGFPPGPICMVSPEALHAVAFPAHTDYLYFRACPGDDFHRFSVTHQEHLDACP